MMCATRLVVLLLLAAVVRHTTTAVLRVFPARSILNIDRGQHLRIPLGQTEVLPIGAARNRLLVKRLKPHEP